MTSIDTDYNEIIQSIKKHIEKKFSKLLTDEQILRKSLAYFKEHLNEILTAKDLDSGTTSEKIKRIINNANEYKLYETDKSDDDLLYGISN